MTIGKTSSQRKLFGFAEPVPPKPILKWAGGKTQLISQITAKFPTSYGKYIEPFIGGGAIFFHLQPHKAVIADSNPELINCYSAIAEDVEKIIQILSKYQATSEEFYKVRKKFWSKLDRFEAAARTIYLNRTCYNGLYRVNQSGQFNVPFGRYENPKICDVEMLRSAASALQKAEIKCGDYKDILKASAAPGDLVYLDPPYLPVSAYSDFKRYTKEQFYEEDHTELANEVKRLHELGCYVVITNSNHPLVHTLYSGFPIDVYATKRNISCQGMKRTGEDVIITVPPRQRVALRALPPLLPAQVQKYPTTRYMGSKSKLLVELWDVASQFNFQSALDLFSGSGIVSYMLKAQGKRVISNDYMAMSATFTKALIENNNTILEPEEIAKLVTPNRKNDGFVQSRFQGLYYSDEDNRFIDDVRANLKELKDPYKRAIGMSGLIRACVKKRARGIFTYVGHRYDDGRRDLQLSLEEQFHIAIAGINAAVFSNGQENKSKRGDALSIQERPDLVYFDPPYYSPLSDNEYVRRYHFVEGLACDWQGVEIQEHTSTKKFKSYPTPFSSRSGAAGAFDKLFHKFRDSILIVSYSSNSLPTLDEMVALLAKHKQHVEVVSMDHKYSFGNQGHKVNDNRNDVKEYLFIGF